LRRGRVRTLNASALLHSLSATFVHVETSVDGGSAGIYAYSHTVVKTGTDKTGNVKTSLSQYTNPNLNPNPNFNPNR